MDDKKMATTNEETSATNDVTGELTLEEEAAAKEIGENLAESTVGIIDLDSREDLYKKFDAAFRIIFGESYHALDNAVASFEYGTERFHVSLGRAIGVK